MKIALYTNKICLCGKQGSIITSGDKFLVICGVCSAKPVFSATQLEMLMHLELVFGCAAEEFVTAIEQFDQVSSQIRSFDAEVLIVSAFPSLCWLFGCERKLPIITHCLDFSIHRHYLDPKAALVDSQTGSRHTLEYLALGVSDLVVADSEEIQNGLIARTNLSSQQVFVASLGSTEGSANAIYDTFVEFAHTASRGFKTGAVHRTSQVFAATELLHESFSDLTSFERFKARRTAVLQNRYDSGVADGLKQLSKRMMLANVKSRLVRGFRERS